MTKFDFVKNGCEFTLSVDGVSTGVGFSVYSDNTLCYAPEFSHTLCNVAFLDGLGADAETTIEKWCGYENIPYEPTLTHLLLNKAISDAINRG